MSRMRNVTLRMADDLLKRAKLLAVHQDTSLSTLLARHLEQVVVQQDAYEVARVRALARLYEGFPGKTGTRSYAWSHDDLHGRK